MFTQPLSSMHHRFAILFCTLLIVANMHSSIAVMSRPVRNNDVSNMQDAVKYLQELDSYYLNAARPRYGKRSGMYQLLKERAAAAAASAIQDDNDLTEWQGRCSSQQ